MTEKQCMTAMVHSLHAQIVALFNEPPTAEGDCVHCKSYLIPPTKEDTMSTKSDSTTPLTKEDITSVAHIQLAVHTARNHLDCAKMEVATAMRADGISTPDKAIYFDTDESRTFGIRLIYERNVPPDVVDVATTINNILKRYGVDHISIQDDGVRGWTIE